MKRLIFILTTAFIFLISAISYSETFKWVDKNGVVHFSDNIESVPKQYRNQIKVIETPVYPEDIKKNETVKDDKEKKKEQEKKNEQPGNSEKNEKK